MKSDDTWTASWCCEKLISHEKIASATPIGGNLVQIIHKERKEPVQIATLSQAVVPASELSRVYTSPNIEFILNIQKGAIFQRDAIEMSEVRRFGLGGLGDLYTAANEGEFRDYLSKEFRFILRGLRQHTRVTKVTRLNNRMLLVERLRMEDKRVLALNEYDLTADAVRTGIEKFGNPDIILASNPNCSPSSEGGAAANACGVAVLGFGDLLRALNH